MDDQDRDGPVYAADELGAGDFQAGDFALDALRRALQGGGWTRGLGYTSGSQGLLLGSRSPGSFYSRGGLILLRLVHLLYQTPSTLSIKAYRYAVFGGY
jgi:hypothetical protein